MLKLDSGLCERILDVNLGVVEGLIRLRKLTGAIVGAWIIEGDRSVERLCPTSRSTRPGVRPKPGEIILVETTAEAATLVHRFERENVFVLYHGGFFPKWAEPKPMSRLDIKRSPLPRLRRLSCVWISH